MSFVGSMLSNSKGAGFQAQGANIINPVQPGQTDTAYGSTQDALKKQQDFLNAVNGANGVGNQASVFNQQQAIANGTGPNPAQAMLNQATGNNVAAQGAMAAGQRGSSANAGLMARQAANVGAQTQQNAAGQAATLQANQSLGALNQMGGIAGNQVANQNAAVQGYNQAAQNEQANLLNAQAQANNANVSMQSNINNANAGIAGINAQGQQQILGGLANGAASAAMMAKGGRVAMADGGQPGPQSAAGKFLSGYSTATAPSMSAQPGAQSPAAKGPALQQGGSAVGSALVGGIKSAFGSGAPAATPTSNVPTANDWAAYAGAPGTTQTDQNASMMQAGPIMRAQGGGIPGKTTTVDPGNGGGTLTLGAPGTQTPAPKPSPAMAKGGKVPVMLSPGEKYLSPKEAAAVKSGKVNPMSVGRMIPGKAKVKGDSYSNDNVPASLEKGGLVIPRSVMQGERPMRDAIKFVHAYMAKGGKVGMKAKGKK